jgi:hypothetical protein
VADQHRHFRRAVGRFLVGDVGRERRGCQNGDAMSLASLWTLIAMVVAIFIGTIAGIIYALDEADRHEIDEEYD